jgi:hypothetical protein
MNIEQTSDVIKKPIRIIEGFVNTLTSAVKINPQEIVTSCSEEQSPY